MAHAGLGLTRNSTRTETEASTTDWNASVIEEFRANEGQIGGNFAGAPLLLLHSTGAKSGEPMVHPMMYQQVDGGWAVSASKAGADTNPAWYFNLVVHPAAQIEVGTAAADVVARVAEGEERERTGRFRRNGIPASPGTSRRPADRSRCSFSNRHHEVESPAVVKRRADPRSDAAASPRRS